MAIDCITYVWMTAKQKGSKLLMLLALADYANDAGECWPGMIAVAQKARMTERNARLILKELEDDKVITIQPHAGMPTRTGATNRYTIVGFVEWRQEVKAISSLNGQGVKPASSLENEGVKFSVARGEIFGRQGVKSASPKPSFKPSMNPSKENKDSYAPAIAVAFEADGTCPFMVENQRKVPRGADWLDYTPKGKRKTKRSATPYEPHHDALLVEFGLNKASMTPTADTNYWKVAYELYTAGYKVEEIPLIHQFIERKAKDEEWSKPYGVNALAKYAPDYRANPNGYAASIEPSCVPPEIRLSQLSRKTA